MTPERHEVAPVAAFRAACAARRLLLVWLAAVGCLCWLYFDGLRTWFCADDFAWLGLLRQTTSFSSLLHSLFIPAAQGTMRFISERGFFLLFESIFGFDNLPWRIAVFATAAGDIALIMWLTRRATGSRLAAAIAPFLWIANASLGTAMAWDSAYNEILCPLFLMAALALFIRYVETGRRVYWWWQLVVFILGFGVLEVNTVYPALAAAWLLTLPAGPVSQRRKLIFSLIPLFAISAVYFVIHRAVAPFATEGPYAFYIDRRIFRTLALYWRWSLLPEPWEALGHSRSIGRGIVALETLALLGSFVRDLRAGRRMVLFFIVWFFVTIAPMLPLPNHRSDYYLTIPVIGLSMLAASSMARMAQAHSGALWRGAAIGISAIYLITMVPAAHFVVGWWYDRSYPIRALVLGVDAAQRTHPDKTIVMDGITDAMWDDAFAHSAFYPLGIDHVYLTPGSADKIHATNSPELVSSLVLDPAVMKDAITHSEVVVYSVVNDHLRNITSAYARAVLTRPPKSR